MADEVLEEIAEEHSIFDEVAEGMPVTMAPEALFEPSDAEATSGELPAWDYRVQYGDDVFTIEEPDLDTICMITNIFGAIFLRSQQRAGAQLKGLFTAMVARADGRMEQQSILAPESLVAGVMAALEPRDIIKLSIVCLFGGHSDQLKEGEEWFKVMRRRGGKVRIAPVVKALAYRIALSEDLAESLGNVGLVQAAAAVWTSRLTRHLSNGKG